MKHLYIYKEKLKNKIRMKLVLKALLVKAQDY